MSYYADNKTVRSSQCHAWRLTVGIIENYLDVMNRTGLPFSAMQMDLWEDHPAAACMEVTHLIAHKFKGNVWTCAGHHFAIVGHYLVDYWAKYVNDPTAHAVIDMSTIEGVRLVASKYLSFNQWERVLPPLRKK